MVYLPMQKNDKKEIEVLKTQCSALEEQVILLVKTELTLRRTQAELIQSKEQIEEYNRTLEQKVEERTRELLQSNEIGTINIKEVKAKNGGIAVGVNIGGQINLKDG